MCVTEHTIAGDKLNDYSVRFQYIFRENHHLASSFNRFNRNGRVVNHHIIIYFIRILRDGTHASMRVTLTHMYI